MTSPLLSSDVQPPSLSPFSPSSSLPPPTPTETAHWRSIFSLFDTHSLGFISTTDLGFVLRSLGYNPTELELSLLLNQTDHDGSGLLSFPAFHALLIDARSTLPPVDSEPTVLSLFSVFDVYRQGRMHVRDVVHALTAYGEPLSTADVDALVSEMDVDGDGMVDLRRFIRHMVDSSAMDGL